MHVVVLASHLRCVLKSFGLRCFMEQVLPFVARSFSQPIDTLTALYQIEKQIHSWGVVLLLVSLVNIALTIGFGVALVCCRGNQGTSHQRQAAFVDPRLKYSEPRKLQ